MISERLTRGEFEHRTHPLKHLFYHVERRVGDRLFKRPPPDLGSPRLLNLGCGPLKYPGWVNADEYAFKRAFRQREFQPDWRLDVSRPWHCPSDYWDGIFSQHVLEHLHYSDVVRVLRECWRTLKPGAWLRISVPGVHQAVSYYRQEADAQYPLEVPYRALALSFLTQMHGHLSAWDGELLCAVLAEVGFDTVSEVSHGHGTDARLVMDQEEKRGESLYVEARKPA